MLICKRIEFLKERYSAAPVPSEPAAVASSPESTPAPIATVSTATPQTEVQQVGNELLDRGRVLNATGIALTVMGGATSTLGVSAWY